MKAEAGKPLSKSCALFIIMCMSCVYVLASTPTSGANEAVVSAVQPQATGKIITTKNQPILVNGNSTTPGTTILTGSTIQTPNNVGATLQLGFAEVDIAPNSLLTVEFTSDGNVRVTLTEGCLIVRTKGRGTGVVITPDGATHQVGESALFDVCFPKGATTPVINQGAAAGAGAGAGGGGGIGAAAGTTGLSRALMVTLIAGAGGAGLIALILANQGGDSSSPNPGG
jgi:hypothetical protein